MTKHKLADPECYVCKGNGWLAHPFGGDPHECICVKEREAINKAESLED